MRHVLMIGLAVICGIMAFGLNFVYLKLNIRPQHYVMTQSAIAVGEVYDKNSFKSIGIQGDIKTAAVPFDEVATLYGRLAPRNLEAGELVLWQDVSPAEVGMDLRTDESGLHIAVESLRIEPGLLRVGDQVGFVVPKAEPGESATNSPDQYEQLGPFRIVSINSEVVQTPYGAPAQTDRSRIATITVATKLMTDGRSFAQDANRLILANAANQVLGITFRGRTIGGNNLTSRASRATHVP